MELSHSLTLNEEALKQIPDAKRSVFVFEWLRFLDKVLIAAQKSDIKGCQKKLVEQLTKHIHESPGPPTRKLIARCLATLFSVGDTFLLFDTVNKCNDILRNKDDSPSYLPTRLAAICCVGCMYEKLGRMMGRSYEETVHILLRSLRSAESQTRIEIMLTLEKICAGMGNAITNIHKDIYKASRHCLVDRVMSVRCAAARCLLEMLNYAPFLYTVELESLATLCFRAFDSSNYEVRCMLAKLLGTLIAVTQQNPKMNVSDKIFKPVKPVFLDDALSVLMSGFLKSGLGFLKGTGEIIKGSSNINREIRVGVTHAYVIFVQMLGGAWLERNIKPFLSHVLYLVANPKAASSHVDAVYSRKCVNFILHSVLGKMLSEKAQLSACKEILQIIVKEMNSIDFNPEMIKDSNQETLFCQHLLVCSLQEIGSLILSLGTTAHDLITDTSINLLEVTLNVLIHPCYAARLAAAWCLRCICIAVPSQITPLIDRCVNATEDLRTSPDAVSGYSGALAAVLGGVKLTPLGIPHTKGKVIFNTAEELLRSASQNSRLSLNRTQAGWLLIGAIITLGVPVVRGLLPRMLLLWRNSFPRSSKELESEKARGDAFTWQVTLEGRAGALSSMHSFLQNCPELVNDDIIRRLLVPVESALAMLSNLSNILKSYGQQLKAPAAIVRLRLYETLLLLPPSSFESSYTHLLRMLVAEFTLTENPANTTTSQLRTVCHADDSVILGTWLQETNHRYIEDQLYSNSAAGSGALEHDPCCLYRPIAPGQIVPGPLPLGVAVIDASVGLFGQIFPRVANKHRLQMLDHFIECIKHTKSSRQEAVQMNIFTAFLSGLKGLTEAKGNFGQEELKNSATLLITGALTSNSPILRCAAGEAVGRMAQVVADSRYTAELAQISFDKLKFARDVASRTGHSLVLGCLHKYVGGMGSSQHLNTSVSILLALAQDTSSPVVQVWSLHALALISESGGPMFRGYVEPSLSLVLKLLLNVPQSYVDVHQCVGKVLSALITIIGPELQGNTASICMTRSSLLCACAIMQDHQDPLVQAEATACLQQLHLFAPKHVNLSSLVPTLCRTLSSNHLLLRKAAISCLRQLTQREAKEVCEHAMTLASESRDTNTVEGLLITDTGLPGVLFSMLDSETDAKLIKDIHDTLTSMLQMLAADNLTLWLHLCKDILTVATDSSAVNEDLFNILSADGNDDLTEPDDDQTEFNATESTSIHSAVQPRWPTRVFAAECVRRIIIACEGSNKAHFDLTLAKEIQHTKNKGDFLVLHLPDLVRMTFVAATSNSDPLRLEGLKTLHEIIEKFAKVAEPEFPGHLLLEQFQAQVSAALRPAFSPETSSLVTATACKVCSTWIGSNVAHDLNDLRRVHQLLVSSLTKFQTKTKTLQLYNESLVTLEKLAILTAWAEVYVVALTGNDATIPITAIHSNDNLKKPEYCSGNLFNLVQPELPVLSKFWFAALKDYALLSLPVEYTSQLPHDGGSFYTTDTMDSSKQYYITTWPSILHAAALWMNSENCHSSKKCENNENVNPSGNSMHNNNNRFYLLFGICMEALCNTRSNEPVGSVIKCLQALNTLLDSGWTREILVENLLLGIELCNVLHRLLLTRDHDSIHLLSMEILKKIIKGAKEQLMFAEKSKTEEKLNDFFHNFSLGTISEDTDNGDIKPGKSLVFAILEVCLCLLVRQIPELSPSTNSRSIKSLRLSQSKNDMDKLVASAVGCMENLQELCSPQGALAILPTILFLLTGIIKEMATKSVNDITILANNISIQTSLHCLKTLVTQKYIKYDLYEKSYKKLLQTTLAKIIDLIKTGSEESKTDEVTMMLTIGIFILHVPSEIVSAPNLLYPCINHFRLCLQSNITMVQLKCIQTLKSVFCHNDPNIAIPYIHAFAPQLMEILYFKKKNISEGEFSVIVESIITMEALINLVDPNHYLQLLALLVPVIISYLLDDKSLQFVNKNSAMLHDYSLQWLMKIGPLYPEEFKIIMSRSTNMRSKLESAIKLNQKSQLSKLESNSKSVSLHQPSIKLKTDFSNFS